MKPPQEDEEDDAIDGDEEEEKSCDEDDYHQIKYGGSNSMDFAQKNKRMVGGAFKPKHGEMYKKGLDAMNAGEDDASVSNGMSSSESEKQSSSSSG